MDYYSILGVKREASLEDIKRAYRSLAMKHHPDRGGDEKRFKEIEEAYRFLSDPQKKQIVDMGGDPNAQPGAGGFNQGPFEFHFGGGNFDDIFNQFGFGFGGRPQRRNKSFSINIEITLEDVLRGKDISAEVGVPGNKSKMINISVPPGIEHGQQIKYQGMGDDSIPGIRAGDLIVNVFIRPHHIFKREGDNLICEKTISVWDAIIGSSIEINTINGKTISVNIPAGTQPETVFGCKGEGLPNVRSKQRGTLLVKIKIDIPKTLNASQLEKIKQIKNGI